MIKYYRPGVIGAILDNYEEVISSLKTTIENIQDSSLTAIIFPESTNGCESIQAILSHVVHSAFGYATSIHNSRGSNLVRPEKTFHITIHEYLQDLDSILGYTDKVLSTFNDHELEQLDPTLKIKTNWGQLYDIEQLMEHAIVHILRHKRQLEKIKLAI